MQFEKPQLEQQQRLLASLGFYSGKLDGIWGPSSIAAKKRYEASESFIPGVPSSGLPFASRPPYPVGISVGPKGLLTHPAMDIAKDTSIPQVPAATPPDVNLMPSPKFVPIDKGTKSR